MNDLMKAREAAEYLGFHEQTVYKWARNDQIPCVRIGGSIRFVKEELDAWIAGAK